MSRFRMLNRRSPRRLQGLSIHRLIPNLITILAMCSGLTAIKFALQGDWRMAVVAIIAAAIFDGLDGRMARLLRSTSRFGAELDSLSDFVSFGVAPAVVLYLWVLQQYDRLGWIVGLFLATCCALRLARFNTALDDTAPPAYAYNYFTGVPSPAGAGLAILPLVLSFELGDAVVRHPLPVAIWTALVGGLMFSRLPTFAFKRLRIPQPYVMPVVVVAGLLVAGLAAATWTTLIILAGLYLASFPVAYVSYRRLERAAARLAAEVTELEAARNERGTA
ncbi:MAG: CDP-diacylglycerol--serine O-phosphatidyltransferase [Thalassobaculales bacterium]